MNVILSVSELRKHFPIKSALSRRPGNVVRAVEDITVDVFENETLGIVGESGCGKSTTARLLMGLTKPDGGTISFGRLVVGRDLSLSGLRRRVQMVFQDSYASLNPRMTVQDSISFGPSALGLSKTAARLKANTLLSMVGLEPSRYAQRYPHELSGGQRQRVNIARALALSPRLLILDEALSALDKSVEMQVLTLLVDLKKQFSLTYIFISHDLNVVRRICDRVAVMYLGEIVEIGNVAELYDSPQHPYSRALLSATPSMDPNARTTVAPLAGDPPNPIDPPPGCRFHPRCIFAEDVCEKGTPGLHLAGGPGHLAACFMVIPQSGHSRAPGAVC